MRDILRRHIATVVGRYRGRIASWDVVNEAVAPPDLGRRLRGAWRRDTFWQRALGDEHLELAFRWAHEADPGARLYYNDYSAEGRGWKSDRVHDLVQGLVRRGAPIHGVGLQAHLRLGHEPSPEDVAWNVRRLQRLGLEVSITELDVRLAERGGSLGRRLREQAHVARGLLRVALETRCRDFVLWGFTDGWSWLTGRPGGEREHPLPFDRAFARKPFYDALSSELAGETERSP